MARNCAQLAKALTSSHSENDLPRLDLFVSGGELVATFPDSVFPIWLGGCKGASETKESMEMLQMHWPGFFSMPSELGAFAVSGRTFCPIRAWFTQTTFAGKIRRPATRLATVVIGTAAALLEWRLGETNSPSAADFVGQFLAVRGELEHTEEQIVVHVKATRVSFLLRRAGLDRDPGYLPWLDRTVVFRFEGDEPEGNELPLAFDKDST